MPALDEITSTVCMWNEGSIATTKSFRAGHQTPSDRTNPLKLRKLVKFRENVPPPPPRNAAEAYNRCTVLGVFLSGLSLV